METLIPITKALADETRIRILTALRGGELCLCQLVALLGLAPSTVSKHVSILRRAGLVESRKEGRWVHCRLAGERAPAVVREALAWVLAHLEGDSRIVDDARQLAEINKMNLEEICRIYLRR